MEMRNIIFLHFVITGEIYIIVGGELNDATLLNMKH